MKDFKCWFPDMGETFEDADDVLQCLDAMQAATECVDSVWSGREWYSYVDCDQILAMVSDEDGGNVRAFHVRLVSTVEAIAREVDVPSETKP